MTERELTDKTEGTLEIVSLGAGVQSSALAILNALGEIESRAQVAVFADTGGEMPETYAHLIRLADWLQRHGIPVVIVRREPKLEERILEGRYPVVPARDGDVILPRRCTTDWKISPIHRWARERGAKRLIIQLGISWDEAHRMRTSRVRWVEHRYPLVDMRLTREDCRRILARYGFQPTKSACFFCPLRPRDWWKWLKAYQPALFERACQVEEALPRRKGYSPYYISTLGKPLREIGDQLPLEEKWDGVCDGGYCFT